MRSSFFITLSILVHIACVTALAYNHFHKPETYQIDALQGGGSMEGSLGEIPSTEVTTASAPISKDLETTTITPDPVKPVAPTASTKPATTKNAQPKSVAKKAPSKQKFAEVTELPLKNAPSEPEKMDPQIDDSQMVAIAPMTEKAVESDEKIEMIPVKDTAPAGVEAATEDEKKPEETEASSQDAEKGLQDQAAVAVEAAAPAAAAPVAAKVAGVSNAGDGSAENSGNKGGATQGAAVSYLSLRQLSGNKPPVYPTDARLEQRQGEVGLLYRVTKEGFVKDIQVANSSGHADLDQAALLAVSKFKFIPGQEGWARHPVQFSLKGSNEKLPSRLRTKAATAE